MTAASTVYSDVVKYNVTIVIYNSFLSVAHEMKSSAYEMKSSIHCWQLSCLSIVLDTQLIFYRIVYNFFLN